MRLQKTRDGILGEDRFGEVLRKARTAHGVPVATIARKARISTDYIYKIERRASDAPNEQIIERIASAFDGELADSFIVASGRMPDDVMRFMSAYPVFCIRLLRNMSRLNRDGLKYVATKLSAILESIPSRSESSSISA